MICDDILSVTDLNNKNRMDSVHCTDHCTLHYIVSRFLTSYSRYVQCAVMLYLQNIDLVNRYRLDSLLPVDQCTQQYPIRLFNSVLKIY